MKDIVLDNHTDIIQSNINIKPIEESINPNIYKDIINSAETSLVNSLIDSNLALRPKLIINNYKQGTKVLADITTELSKCEEFMISVAFITYSGIIPLLETLRILNSKGIKGKIITTNYLNFSEPKALRKLLSFSNLELKMYTKENFHTKGYIFKHSDHYKIIVGSSNLTQNALTKNKEWNIKLSSLEEGELTGSVLKDFRSMWKDSEPLTLEILNTYEEIYKKQREITRNTKVPSLAQYKLKPNKMQTSAINSLKKLRLEGKTKALLISATGTGKTYLSAFDVREFNPNKGLFIVHREQIAKQALESYQNVFGDTKSLGILSGNSKDFNKDIVFATIQTLSKDNILLNLSKNEFDYIVIDEVHRAGAASYQKILNHFTPKFLLGMSATPERTDDFDIFKLFDYNIAYEIRLQQALEEDLLCPFHYFGIQDISINGKEIEDKSDFNLLIDDERVNHIIDKINFYGYCGERVKGLIFCSNKEEAKRLSMKFNERGYNTTHLTGDDPQDKRNEAIKRLEQDEEENSLDYIFTVDIFNEGVDIPSINQVIMLRPTKSAIIFVQQLGRGLRKFSHKEYVVILDFVGNYDKNFLIPIALSGDKSYNKDTIRKYVSEGNRIIPGCSTINFDEVSKKRIFESIDKAKFNSVALIKENYLNLKQKLGRIPKLKEFDKFDSIDPLLIFNNNSLGSYHKFLSKYEKDYSIKLSKLEEEFIEYISKKFASGKRPHELITINLAINNEDNLISKAKDILNMEYGIAFNDNTKDSIVNNLINNFASGSSKDTYKNCIFIEKEGNDYKTSNIFKALLENIDFKNVILELIDFALYRYTKSYSHRYKDTNFALYEKYTYEDVCRLLDWEKGEVALNIGGYKYDKKTNTFPVFINYNKSEEISETIKYEDRFISPSNLIAISKSGRTADSSDVKQIYNTKETGTRIHLFVRKNKDDKTSKEFYYLGEISAFGNPHPIKVGNKNAVEISYKLDTAVRDDIYDYIIS